ncbi:PsiF family protein [Bradyrhizobium sp. BEA-2-5]|uniref:PsiF family protein n=1 Tax=Bradyrhizobium TaxID=374 RepID=UPI000429C43B|nr:MULTISPECIES: PsiF family protein [Bradyrhizobium]WOH82663.1 PsiF family protein [Bradyrhizobium sp. BEA-2-5]
MKTISMLASATALASLLLTGGAFAQTAAPAAKDAAPKAETKAPAEKKQRTAESLECSKEADAKGLHGKERKKFRSECKKEKSGGAAAAPAATK